MELSGFAPIEIGYDFSVPTENVFNAWTNPDIIKKWMFKGEQNDIIQVINNIEQNGAFSVIKKGEKGDWIDHYGTYHEIAFPNLLSFSLESPERFPGVSNVVIRIMPTEKGSHMNFIQTGVDPKNFTASWKQMFARLASILREL